MDKSQTAGLDILLSNEKTRSLPVNGDCGLFANYSVCYSRFAGKSRQTNSKEKQKKKKPLEPA